MRVLVISTNFFDYPQFICEQLGKMGIEADWFDDRPSSNSFVKAIIRINKNFISKFIEKYFQNVMQIIGGKKYDKVLIISGQSFSFSEEMVQQLKEKQSQAEFILYQWDSLENFPYIERMHKFFDRCYSFDRKDVQKDTYIQFLPLFYSERYERIAAQHKKEYKYDLSFVGTAHPKKYKYVKEMALELKGVFPKQFIYFFFPSKLVYIYRKIKNVEFKNAKYSEFNFKALNGAQMDEIVTNSKCVLDSAQANQNGLTIRVIEMLGAKKKIITTNEDVVNYDFYRPENVYVYNSGFDLNNVFFKSPYQEIEDEIYKKYSLESWLKTLLNL